MGLISSKSICCIPAAKALVRLHICTVLPEPRLLDDVISTKIGITVVLPII